MKKILVIIPLTVIFAFTSCSKQVKEQLAVDTQKVEEVLNFKGDPGSRVTAFNILNAAEKAYAFKKHIQDNYKKLALNDAQIDLAKEAIEMIVPEMYMDDKKDNYSGIVAKLGHQATQLFSLKQYVSLFQNIEAIEENPYPTASLNEPGGGNCFCRWDATCSAYADTKGPDCITGQGGCTPTNSGCGWLWLSSCTGDCGRKTPTN